MQDGVFSNAPEQEVSVIIKFSVGVLKGCSDAADFVTVLQLQIQIRL